MTAPSAAKITNPTAPRTAALTRPRLVGAPSRMTGRAKTGRASRPPTPRRENAASPPTVESVSLPLVASMRNWTAAPTAAPPGMISVIALPASRDVTTGNHALVRSASRCSANVQMKWAISAPTATANHRGSRVDRRGQDANTSVIAGNTR